MADVTLTGATRGNLLSLQNTTQSIAKTQERLATGKKVNSAIDDALAFFKSRDLSNRASDLASIKDSVTQAIAQITTATQGLDSIESTLKQMKAIASAARASTDSGVRTTYAGQFNELRSQIDHVANDSEYDGINLLKATGDNINVKFSEKTASTASIQVLGLESTATGLSVGSANTAAAGWGHTTATTYQGQVDSAVSQIDSALSTVRTNASTLGTNAAMLEIRRDFTQTLISTLKTGASDLVNAEINEESANMLALQTRQQLGTISLSIAQQSEQAVLRLF